MSEYETTRCLAPWKGTLSTSYLVVGSQRVNFTSSLIYLDADALRVHSMLLEFRQLLLILLVAKNV